MKRAQIRDIEAAGVESSGKELRGSLLRMLEDFPKEQ